MSLRLALAMSLAACSVAAPALATSSAADRATYVAIAKREAEREGLPLAIAEAVMSVESGFDPTRVGSVGEVGLMQVRPGTAALLGFRGSAAELASPEVNIHFGVSYLAKAWRLAGGDLCRALMKYRAGHGEDVMSPLSALYCQRARAFLTGTGSSPDALVSMGAMPNTPSAATSRSTLIASRLPPAPRFRRGVSEAAFRDARTRYVHALTSALDLRRAQREATLTRMNQAFLTRTQNRTLVASAGRTGRD